MEEFEHLIGIRSEERSRAKDYDWTGAIVTESFRFNHFVWNSKSEKGWYIAIWTSSGFLCRSLLDTLWNKYHTVHKFKLPINEEF
jgi:hypothetical protein